MPDTSTRNEAVLAAAPERSTAAAENPKAPKAPKVAGGADAQSRMLIRRRRFTWTCIGAFLATCFGMFLRFFFPRVLFEPSTVFTVGPPSDFGLGVDTKFQQEYRIWVVRNAFRLFVIYARCTHLGCTPDWKPSENKFKCPCHGSGYDSEGVNFEGPAPRPMDRAKVDLDVQGNIVVDTSKLYTCPKGGRCEFDDPGSFLTV